MYSHLVCAVSVSASVGLLVRGDEHDRCATLVSRVGPIASSGTGTRQPTANASTWRALIRVRRSQWKSVSRCVRRDCARRCLVKSLCTSSWPTWGGTGTFVQLCKNHDHKLCEMRLPAAARVRSLAPGHYCACATSKESTDGSSSCLVVYLTASSCRLPHHASRLGVGDSACVASTAIGRSRMGAAAVGGGGEVVAGADSPSHSASHGEPSPTR